MHKLTVQYAAPESPASFDRRYGEEHVPLVRAVPGLSRFTLSRPRALGGDAPYLVAELWFDDEAALTTALRSPELAAAGRHAAGLGAATVMFTGEVEEH